MKHIKDIFFDLDRTIWDFETNSKKVLEWLYQEYNLNRYFDAFPLFYKKYQSVNDAMWQQYYKKEVTKDDVRLLRFYHTIGEEQKMCEQMSQDYIELSVQQTAVFPYSYEILETLKQRGYKLHIITNGFREVQFNKLNNCKLTPFFETVSTSEDAKYHKPHRQAFLYALNQAKTDASQSAMVGDDLQTDISGAKEVGMLSIYFNPKRYNTEHNADVEVFDLRSLEKVFL